MRALSATAQRATNGRQQMSKTRRTVISVALTIMILCGVFTWADYGSEVAMFFLFPGVAAENALRMGSHDLLGFSALIFVNSAVYFLVIYLLMAIAGRDRDLM